MWEPSDLTEKKISAETHKLVGEEKLHEFGNFVEEFAKQVNICQSKELNKCNLDEKIVFINEEVNENVSIIYLAQSDNATLSRILTTLAGICQEIDYLKNESDKLFPSFLFYGEENGKAVDNLESISNLIEPLQRTLNLVKRAKIVILLTLKQLSAILLKGYYISNSTPSFSEVLGLLADLLICLLKFDTLLDEQILRSHWALYRRSVTNILHKSSNLGFNITELRNFNQTLRVLENTLFTGSILKDSIESCLENKLIIEIKKSSLNIEIYNFLYVLINELEKDEENIFYMEKYLQLNVLAAFYLSIFGHTDKKLVKKLLDLDKKVSTCNLIGNILWYPEQFLLKHVQSLAKLIDEKSFASYRLSHINVKVQNLSKDTNIFCMQACCFLIDLEKKTKINPTELRVKDMKEISLVLLNGLKLLKKINWTITLTLNIHMDKNLAVTKSVLSCIYRLIEALKGVYASFQRHMLMINYFLLLISQHLQHTALTHLEVVKKHQTQLKSYKNEQLDILSAIKVCQNALKGPNTRWRILVANLALSASGLSSVQDTRTILDHLRLISNFSYFLKSFCDCSVLYWHFSYVVPVCFSKLIATKSNISKIMPLLCALSDCNRVGAKDISSETNEIIQEKLCAPLNQIIETNLRLQTHLHLQLPPSDPFQNHYSLNFRKIAPFPLNGAYENIKTEIEHYLSTTFYNLTTVVLHDWRTYGEMRRLASLQYGLETIEDDLPMQTIDQGLDVLEIMRNIHIFVERYLYNLNTQIFIEESSNNKHLNSINISHVANSIRTHGIGIMNTTVNYTYQFLKNKFRIFSQFLFDEQIKSRLLKDIRHFKEHNDDYQQMYPYERADKFNKGIRKLGSPDGVQSYLDHFRKVITQIDSLRAEQCFVAGRDDRNRTQFLKLTPIKQCQANFRCFENTLNNNCKDQHEWIGSVICDAGNGWYPAAVYGGPCGFSVSRQYTSVRAHQRSIRTIIGAETTPEPVEEPSCDFHRCPLGNCVPKDRLCDDISDCDDDSDESAVLCYDREHECNAEGKCDCPRNSFKCKNDKCHPKGKFCDATDDCDGSEDEPAVCLCRNYLELTHPEKVCDGVLNCFDRSDEDPEVCPCKSGYFQCGVTHKCVPQDLVCDGSDDCPAGEDEADCLMLERFDNQSDAGEVKRRTAGVWHSGCFNSSYTEKELDDFCRKFGYSESRGVQSATTQPVVAAKAILDSFDVVWLRRNPRDKFRMPIRTGNDPYVGFVPDDECYRLFIVCQNK